ncbi:MAG: energy-coupling factor transporter ATPase [Epulopiscium sp. Nuni2H_MBin003]|nr:MAG: energy-coupling factor transporter ATPase [Epulopiscium sp. Nuni2H_MBin003]
MPFAIQTKDLTHVYNQNTSFEKKVLDNINIKVEKGEFVGIIGHTGSGKSTLIQTFNGLIKPTEGLVLINGETKFRDKVGLVFQYPEHQLFELTVYKDVEYGPTNLGLDEQEIKKRVENSLRLVGIPEKIWQNTPFSLSGGQKRRVAIAGVLAMNPEILVLDEPTAGLDPKGRDELFNQLQYMHKNLGITIVLISHSMEDVAKYVDKVIVLEKGKVKYCNTPKEVFKNVEELEGIGLAPPQIKYIIKELINNGIEIDENILTVEEAAVAISHYLKNR